MAGTDYKSQPLMNDPIQRNVVADNYQLLSISLAGARTNVVVASKVIAVGFVSVTAGGTFSIKLFDATHDALDQTDFPGVTPLNNIAATDLILTNAAQAGVTLKLFVLEGG